MSPVPFLLLLLPLAEIALFILVGGEIGVLPAIGLTILSSVVGGILLRIQGFGVMRRIRTEMDAGRDPSRELAHGAMIMLAGILLLIPGFLSDIFGLLLFVPPIRDLAWRALKGRITVIMPSSFGFPGGGSRSRGKTIDLDEEDFSRAPDPKSPWRLDKPE